MKLHRPYAGTSTFYNPTVVTIIGMAPHGDAANMGIETSLRFSGGQEVMCNVLNLRAGQEAPRPANFIDNEPIQILDCSERFLRRVCFAISDIVCIVASSWQQAADEVFRFVNAQDPESCSKLPEIIILLKNKNRKLCLVENVDINEKFMDFMSQQWREKRRHHGVFHNRFCQISKRISLRLQPLGHIFEHILQHINRFQTHKKPLKEIVSNVEKLCRSPLISKGASVRGNYWPGTSPRKSSGLANWMNLVNTSGVTESDLAIIVARLLLQDGLLVFHGMCA